MNRRIFSIVTAVATATALPLIALAQWQGAPGTPPNSNAKGPVWLQSSTAVATPQVGRVSITEGRINSATHTQDLYIQSGKSLRTYGSSAAGVLNFGNFEATGTAFTLGVYGNLNIPGFGGANTGQICLNGTCISSWPGAPADVWVNTTGDTMTGSLTISSGNSLCLGGVCNSSWPSSGGTIGGSGTNGYVPRFTNSTTLGNSAIQSDGTRVGIGAAPIVGNFVNVNAGSDSTALRAVTNGDTGVYGQGNTYGLNGSGGTYGVYGGGGTYGVYGYGGTGVYGNGNPTGVFGAGNTYGLYGQGGSYGVYGNGSSYGVYASSNDIGVRGEGVTHGVYGNAVNWGVTGFGQQVGVQGFGVGNGNGIQGTAAGSGISVFAANAGSYGFYTDQAKNYFGGVYLGFGNCGGYKGLFFADNSTCGNYSILGGDGNTYINAPAGAIVFRTNSGGVTVAQIDSGNAYKPGGGSWAALSDARLKDVTGTFTRGIEDVLKIQPVSYKYKKDNAKGVESEHEHIGVVAQEIMKVIPEAVTKDPDGYYVVNNDPVIWSMVNSIKELKAENDALKTQNADFAERLKALEARQ